MLNMEKDDRFAIKGTFDIDLYDNDTGEKFRLYPSNFTINVHNSIVDFVITLEIFSHKLIKSIEKKHKTYKLIANGAVRALSQIDYPICVESNEVKSVVYKLCTCSDNVGKLIIMMRDNTENYELKIN
jgi:hypothetical protein